MAKKTGSTAKPAAKSTPVVPPPSKLVNPALFVKDGKAYSVLLADGTAHTVTARKIVVERDGSLEIKASKTSLPPLAFIPAGSWRFFGRVEPPKAEGAPTWEIDADLAGNNKPLPAAQITAFKVESARGALLVYAEMSCYPTAGFARGVWKGVKRITEGAATSHHSHGHTPKSGKEVVFGMPAKDDDDEPVN